MSLTHEFENREADAEGRPCYYPHDVEQLLDHARKLEAMLKKHEWCDNHADDELDCKECGYSKLIGHAPDCALAKLLEGVE